MRIIALVATSLPLLVSGALAQSWPSKSIRVVVPFPAGGPTDATARVLAPRLSEFLGQQVIVDNRGGASSIIGSEIVARAPPDGHHLLLASSALVINPSVCRSSATCGAG